MYTKQLGTELLEEGARETQSPSPLTHQVDSRHIRKYIKTYVTITLALKSTEPDYVYISSIAVAARKPRTPFWAHLSELF